MLQRKTLRKLTWGFVVVIKVLHAIVAQCIAK
jgi:hypothetical protein